TTIQAQGEGGGGAFILAAPQIVFSGTGSLGSGSGALYGSLTNNVSFPDGSPAMNSFADWQALSIDDHDIPPRAGGGGGGGDGQILDNGLSGSAPLSGGMTLQAPSLTGGQASTFQAAMAPVASSTFHPAGSAFALLVPPAGLDPAGKGQITGISGTSPPENSRAAAAAEQGFQPQNVSGDSILGIPDDAFPFGGAASSEALQPVDNSLFAGVLSPN